VRADEQFTVPSLETFQNVIESKAEGREISTRILIALLRGQALGPAW
jgi:pyruvate dehydrogenase E1 component